MARIRRVGKYASFTPPTFLEGVAQVADLWGESSGVSPPRIVYAYKKSPKTSENVFCNSGTTIKSCLGRDVRKIGKDIYVSIVRYGSQLPPATAMKVRHAVERAERQAVPPTKAHQEA